MSATATLSHPRVARDVPETPERPRLLTAAEIIPGFAVSVAELFRD